MAEIVHQEIIDIQVKNGDKNIKNLRKQIKELKDEIANLTLNGKDATNAQKKLTDANKELADAMAQVNKVIVDNISDTDTSTMSYNEMSKELNLLRKAAKDAGDTITRQKYSARIQELDKALKSIDAEMGVFNRNVGNYSEGVEQGTASMRQQIKELRDELTKLSPETEEYANKLVLLAENRKYLPIFRRRQNSPRRTTGIDWRLLQIWEQTSLRVLRPYRAVWPYLAWRLKM